MTSAREASEAAIPESEWTHTATLEAFRTTFEHGWAEGQAQMLAAFPDREAVRDLVAAYMGVPKDDRLWPNAEGTAGAVLALFRQAIDE